MLSVHQYQQVVTNEVGESRTETRKQQKAIHGDVGRGEGEGEGEGGGGLEGKEWEGRQRGMGAGEGVRGVEQGIKLCPSSSRRPYHGSTFYSES